MSARRQSLIRSGVLVGGPELVRELGGDPQSVIRAVGLTAKALRFPETPIPISAAVHFFEVASQLCNCPAFGLKLGERQQLSLFGPLSPLFESATTIRELMIDLAVYFPLLTQGALVSLENEGEDMVLTYELAAGISEYRRQAVELGFGLVVAQIRLHSPGWAPEAVWFRHSRPSDLRDHRQRLCHRITFNADRNGLLIAAETLALPTLSGDRQLHSELAAGFEHARHVLAGAFRTRMEIVVRALLPFAPYDLAATAAMMRCSSRTLQRRLAVDGTSFDDIVDGVRADLAQTYLRDSDLPVAHIAEILQYSETSALSRACRRWFGSSPRELRRAATGATESRASV